MLRLIYVVAPERSLVAAENVLVGHRAFRRRIHQLHRHVPVACVGQHAEGTTDKHCFFRPVAELLARQVATHPWQSSIRFSMQLGWIVQHGFDRSSIAVIRGLSNRAVRSRAGKLIAIGTSAIEVGVDFDCDLLLFEAFEAASFLQRFGRAGRHRTGDVFMFVPSNAIKAMSSAPDIIDRSAFERLIYDCYPLSDARPWFGATELGLLTAASIPERLYQTVERDWNASEKLLSRFRDRLDAMFAEHGSALGCGKVLDRVKAKLDGYRRPVPIPNMRWYRAYVRLNRFRTSMPSVGVHDWREHNRRGEWELGSYEVDIGTLLKRVRNIRRHPTAGLLISGIGSSRRVHAGESAAHLPQGVPLLTAEIPVRLLQDGLETPISDYLS